MDEVYLMPNRSLESRGRGEAEASFCLPPVLSQPQIFVHSSRSGSPVMLCYAEEVFRRRRRGLPIMQKRCFPNGGNWNWISGGDGVEKNEGSHPTPIPTPCPSPNPVAVAVGVGGD